MYGTSVILLTIVVTSVQGFFFLLEKKQAFYCSKVCPLYCPELSEGSKAEDKRARRHTPHYEYYEPDIYEEFPPYIDADDFEDFPYHGYYHRFHHKKPTTTTTTEKPTTEEPTLICQVCKKKCKN